MSEPDPQSSQPRPISTSREVLTLMPSAYATIATFIGFAWLRGREKLGEEPLDAAGKFIVVNWVIAACLCFILGFCSQKCRDGNQGGWLAAIATGFHNLIINSLISFMGWWIISRL